MTQFKGTKGEWKFDKKTGNIKNENVKGLLATAWSVYDSETEEERLNGESWIDMRKRTESVRVKCEEQKLANAKLISCAPEMLQLLIYLNNCGGLGLDKHDKIDELIKKATE